MKRVVLASLLFVLVGSANAAEHDGITATVEAHVDLGIAQTLNLQDIVFANVVEYSNITNFQGGGFSHQGAVLQGSNTITSLLADDITPTGATAGGNVTTIRFSVVNFNMVAVSVRARLRFWFADGVGGGPGTYYDRPSDVGFTVNALSYAPGVSLVSAAIPPGIFTMPGERFWAGIAFDDNNGMTGATATQLNNFGQALFDPPTVGASDDQHFLTTAGGSFFAVDNPAGTLGDLGPIVASYGWEFIAEAPTPAPTFSALHLLMLAVMMAILGAMTLARVRRER